MSIAARCICGHTSGFCDFRAGCPQEIFKDFQNMSGLSFEHDERVTQLLEAAREAKGHIEALAGIIKQEPFQKLFDALKPFEK